MAVPQKGEVPDGKSIALNDYFL